MRFGPLLLLTLLLTSSAATLAGPLRFSVLMHAARGGDEALRAALDDTQSRMSSFIVVNGLKDDREPCTEKLFRQRKTLLDSASVPVVLSMAGSDWTACRDRHGRPAPTVWLNLLRDQLYGETSGHGSKRLSVKRQSALPAFRDFAENSRWTSQRVQFATLHLPAPNNHFVAAAGQNSEFEDRLTANRDWLRRLAVLVRVEKLRAVVLFCDGNPLPAASAGTTQRDGFQEIRALLRAFAAKVNVPVLIVQGPTPRGEARITMRGKLAYVNLEAGVTDIAVDPESPAVFSLPTEDGENLPQ